MLVGKHGNEERVEMAIGEQKDQAFGFALVSALI